MSGSFVAASSRYLSATAPQAGGTTLSMACWFYPTVAASQFLLTLSDGTTARVTISMSSVSFIAGSCNTGGTQGNAVVATTPTLDTWNHGCGTFTSTTSRKAYLNGTLTNTDATNITAGSFTSTLVGARRSGGTVQTFFDGRICEVGIWAAVLTDADVLQLSLGVSPSLVRPQNLIFYAPLIRNFIDIKASRTITNNGSVTVSDQTRVYM